MGLSLENAFRIVETTDSELLNLRRKARETQQDVAGLTPDQTEKLHSFDGLINGEHIVNEFDLEQQQVLHPDIPNIIFETSE